MNRDHFTNPYATSTRQNGVTRGRQDWSDLQDMQDKLDAGSTIVHTLILGMAIWGVIGAVALLLLGVL